MNTDSKSNAFLLLSIILSAIVLAKLFWSAIDYKYLPKVGVNKEESTHIKPLYYRYNIASKKEKPKIIAPKPKKHIVKKALPKPELITKFSLKGIIYSKTTQIVTVTYQNKDAILSPGDQFEGYTLKKVYPTYAIFTKDGKEYQLNLYKNNKNENQTPSISHPTPIAPKPQTKKAIYKEGDTTIISKSVFNKYKKNLRLIQQNIGVVPLYSGKKLTGFRVSYIKKGSDFDKLGLKRGDIIKAVNGEELNSFEVPLRIFNNIDSMTAATITIQRGSETKELEYEVH